MSRRKVELREERDGNLTAGSRCQKQRGREMELALVMVQDQRRVSQHFATALTLWYILRTFSASFCSVTNGSHGNNHYSVYAIT